MLTQFCTNLVEAGAGVLLPLLLWNIVVFSLYAADKARAKRHAWRIPEATLLTTAFLFGSVGALAGMFLLRHKTKHVRFLLAVPLFFVLHMVILGVVCHLGGIL